MFVVNPSKNVFVCLFGFFFFFFFWVQNVIFGWINGKVLTLVDRRLTLALTLL